ncbi:hypothetical protein WN944_028837 [Citrus x changshan-huyou]|uniref:DUF8039 domain-containing protein n=1 Tax=Citrus x changshan-huyou TaxID=2935761 RepID=A0AAP0LLA9_9ROSI
MPIHFIYGKWSSQQASKRKRKESLSSRFESSDAPIIETHLTDEDLNDATSENPYQSCNEENLTKKKRGPTVCHDVANEDGKKIVLELNNLGQPIGKSSVLYSSFYGSLVKEAVSINCDDWRYVPKQQKALLLRALEDKSKVFKEMRAKQDIPYTGSRMGYARMQDKMKKNSSNPSEITRIDVWIKAHTKKNGEPSSSKVVEVKEMYEAEKNSDLLEAQSKSVKNDILSKFIGPEQGGRVRGQGAGVTLSKLEAISQQTKKEAKMQEQIDTLQDTIKQMQGFMDDQNKLIQSLMSKLSEASNDGQNQNLSTSTQSNSTPQHVSPNRKGQKCKLLNWLEVDEVVAIGRWVTNDPNAMVHCVALGKNASRVWVDEVKNPSAELWKKYADMETIEDALGSSIAWPTEAIIVMED